MLNTFEKEKEIEKIIHSFGVNRFLKEKSRVLMGQPKEIGR